MKKKLLITMGCSFTEGVGCYDPSTIPSDMIDRMKHPKVEEVYINNKQRFHKFSWPSRLQKLINYDVLINLGFGGSSTSGNVKVWFEKYHDKNFTDEFDVLLIWLLPAPSRFSFYRSGSIMNINPALNKNVYNIHSYDLGKEYAKFIDDIELDPILEQIFYLKVMEDHIKSKKFNFLFSTFDNERNKFFEKFHNSENRMIFEKSLFPNFEKHPEMKSLVCDHPNELGYEYISQQIFDWIQKNKPELISPVEPSEFESTWDGYPIFDHLQRFRTLI